LGLLKTVELEGSANALLAFHDSKGTSTLTTLTARGIFGADEDGTEGYHSCMLIFR